MGSTIEQSESAKLCLSSFGRGPKAASMFDIVVPKQDLEKTKIALQQKGYSQEWVDAHFDEYSSVHGLSEDDKVGVLDQLAQKSISKLSHDGSNGSLFSDNLHLLSTKLPHTSQIRSKFLSPLLGSYSGTSS